MWKFSGRYVSVSVLLLLCLCWINVCNGDGDGASKGGNIKADPLSIILLQGFNWESSKSGNWYGELQGSVKDVAAAGITDVWLPPPSQSVGPQGYMPAKLYDLDESKYGNQAQLTGLVQSYHQNGVRCVGDIVINHRCGSKQDDKGMWCIFEGGTSDDRLDWGPWAIPVNDKPYSCGTGQGDTGDDYTAAPDIDHTNPKVQSDLVEWMNWLKSEIGFDGWRFDFVKGYAGRFVGQYVDKTQAAFAVGELWDTLSDPDAHRQQLVDWVHSTGGSSSAFDFTTKGVLQEAVNGQLQRMRDSNGKPSGMIGVLPEKAVTLVENHDTGSTQNLWPFPSDKLMQGYAYILTHPGTPSIFYDHFFQFKDQITTLIAIRKRNQIKANSTCKILAADADLYMAAIDDSIVMKIGPRADVGNLAPSAQFHVAASGTDYCVWEKKTS